MAGIPVKKKRKSGAGKSRSLKTFASDEIYLINTISKPLPFKGAFKLAQNVAPQAKALADADMALDSVMAEEAAEAPAAPAYHARPSFGGRVAPAAAAPALSVKKEKAAMAQNVRQVRNRTFFYKNNQWVDTSLTEAQQNAAPRKIKQFSDEYFALARTADPELAACLTFEQPVLLNVNNEPVLIEP